MYTHTHIHRYTCTLLLGCLCCLVASLAAWLSRSNMVSLSALHTLTPAHAQSVHCSVAGAELWLRLTLFSQMSLTHFYQLQKGQSALHCYRRRFTLTPAWRASMCERVCVCLTLSVSGVCVALEEAGGKLHCGLSWNCCLLLSALKKPATVFEMQPAISYKIYTVYVRHTRWSIDIHIHTDSIEYIQTYTVTHVH